MLSVKHTSIPHVVRLAADVTFRAATHLDNLEKSGNLRVIIIIIAGMPLTGA